MEVEENGCDFSAGEEKINLVFTSEENTRESNEASEEMISESRKEPELSKFQIEVKETKNLKAKNDIEDDIRMICGSEELNRSSQDKEDAVDNNILETLQEQTDMNQTEINKNQKSGIQQQINLKRTHSQNSMDCLRENDDQDLFGFCEGKFVFGKKIRINSTEISSEMIDSKYKKNNTNVEKILDEIDKLQNKQNGKIEKPDKQDVPNLVENKPMISELNDAESSKVSPHQTHSTPSTTQKLRPSEDPIYRKPFEMGWKREIVLRALPGSKDKGEVYYITPTGKKLRTRHEIQINLTAGLTLENFTFSKDPLGADPEAEIIRSAKPTGRNSEISAPRTPELSTPTHGKRVPKPKGPKGASPPPQGWTSTQAVKTQGSRFHTRNLTTTSDDQYMKSTRGLTGNTSGNENSSNVLKSSNSSKKVEPCTIECVLAMGLIPQLRCIKCLCLFHHECVGLDRSNDDFQSRNANDSSGRGKNVYECEPCKAQNISKTDKTSLNNFDNLTDQSQKTIPLQLNHGNKFSDLEKSVDLDVSNVINSISVSDKTISKNIVNTPRDIQNIVSTRHPKTLKYISKPTNISPTHAQSIAVLNGRKYLVIHKPGISSNEQVEISTSSSSKSSPVKIQYVDSYVHNLFGNVSAAYDIILNVFKYLKVQELLRAACVSRLWNHLANERSLWKVVRMKNSQVNDWAGFAATLSRNSTQHLDLRKMICPKSGVEKMWTNFNENIQKVFTLKTIDLGRCPANVVQNLFITSPQLNILNATSIKSESINLENLNKLSNLTELRLKSVERCNLIGDLSSFAFLKNLQHLSLTAINDLGTKNIEILGQLTELESLEIGECSSIQQNFASDVLSNLRKLQRLRLEKSTELSVTFSILDQIAEMESLHQLEFVNFDIRDGFEQKIIACKNLKRFLLIPTYVSQSATTNQIILSAMRKLKTLESFTWVVTLELLSVTALYVDQCGSRDRRNFNDCIPVLKPVPGALQRDKEDVSNKTSNTDIQQIEILPLSTIKEILDDGTPNTKHKIVRAAYATTWRQTFVE